METMKDTRLLTQKRKADMQDGEDAFGERIDALIQIGEQEQAVEQWQTIVSLVASVEHHGSKKPPEVT